MQRVHSEAATHKAGSLEAALHKVTSVHVLEGYTKGENEHKCCFKKAKMSTAIPVHSRNTSGTSTRLPTSQD